MRVVRYSMRSERESVRERDDEYCARGVMHLIYASIFSLPRPFPTDLVRGPVKQQVIIMNRNPLSIRNELGCALLCDNDVSWW